MNSKQRCLAAIHGQPVDRTPVFPLLMFFTQHRAGITYRQFATDGQALAEAQLRIAGQFPIDVVTACSDAFRVPADLGAEMVYPDDKTPFSHKPLIATAADLARLGHPDPTAAHSRMNDRLNAVRAMAQSTGDDHLVVGWVEMPFAEACSLVGVSEFMMLMIDEPELAHAILEYITSIEIEFALAQLAAGAPMIGAGDAAASLVSATQYREFVLPYEQRVVQAIHQAGGLLKLHICGNTSHLMADLLTINADLYNVDHLVDFQLACDTYGKNGACFKGNLNPVTDLLQATPEHCHTICLDRLRRASGLRYMLSPGCEIPAATPDATFRAFCESPQKDANS